MPFLRFVLAHEGIHVFFQRAYDADRCGRVLVQLGLLTLLQPRRIIGVRRPLVLARDLGRATLEAPNSAQRRQKRTDQLEPPRGSTF